jgi:hypothetical protein
MGLDICDFDEFKLIFQVASGGMMTTSNFTVASSTFTGINRKHGIKYPVSMC